MNKRFLLKGILCLYNSFNSFNSNSFNSNSFNVNTKATIQNLNSWFNMSYSNIYNLAVLSHNVYYDDNKKWYNQPNFNKTWDINKDPNNIKAFLFSSDDNKTHIISIKGTSTFFGKINILNSIYNDKFNDNLYYSCCFYKQSNLFNKIDELKNEKCWNNELYFKKEKLCKKKCFNLMNNNKLNYITIMKNIIKNLQKNYNNIDFANDEILFTGHSLGGSIATAMGVIYNKPAISFQSPGIKHFLEQSNIIQNFKTNNYSYDNIYNFGHNADIIFKGKCHGTLSLCYLGGYNIETKCHIGKVCEYDALNKLNISESIFSHKLKYVIQNILPNWENNLPECKIINECNDCEKWSFI